MLRAFARTLFLASLLLLGSGGLWYYYHASPEHRIAELEQQKKELEQVVSRLNADRRVAKILVTDQHTENGVLRTTLLFVEYARDGSTLPAKQFVIDGDEAHFDAEVIKFDDHFVEGGDKLRGHSILLFTRVYGATQTPAQGYPIDEPGKVPDLYRGEDPEVSGFEQNLWRDFWKLYEDKNYRQKMGVRGAHGEGLWGRFDPDHLYMITVEANGGGTLTAEPIEPIYREAMKRRP